MAVNTQKGSRHCQIDNDIVIRGLHASRSQRGQDTSMFESNFVIFFNISAIKKGAEECPRYYQTRGVKLIDDCAVGD